MYDLKLRYKMQPFMRVLVVFLLFSVTVLPKASAAIAEVYSETNFVPQFGLLSDAQVRVKLYQSEVSAIYVGAALQRQDKINSDDEILYSKKNRTLAVVGGRITIWKTLTAFAEYRSERRSRYGLYAGNIFEYQFKEMPLFSEVYAETVALPSFHRSPVTTVWFKQGLRNRLTEKFIVDPYAELYLRRSPTPDLGRDTEQVRLGVRGIYLFATSWSAQLLVYQSFEKHQRDHEEAILVIGGEF